MVEDPSTTQLIRWSKNGNSFLVEGHEEFAKTVLPRFYKHNTFASFVRQLNMYDFHKVPHIQQGVLFSTNAENEVWEFSNPNFRKNRPDLLVLVTRKRNRGGDDSSDAGGVNLGSLVKEISAIRQHQTNITADLRNLHRDNEIIWKETLVAREKHQKHQQVISKILQFLTAAFSNEHHQLEGVLHEVQNRQTNDSDEMNQLPQFLSKPNPALQSDSNTTSDSNGSSDSDIIDPNIGISSVKLNNCPKEVTPLKKNNVDVILSTQPQGIAASAVKGNHDNLAPSFIQHSSSASSSGYKRSNGVVSTDRSYRDASRSAEAITNDIDELQDNVEMLAAQLGIDSSKFAQEEVENYGPFSDNYSAMISSASENDKLRLFELADDSKKPIVSPQTHLSTQFDVSGSTKASQPQHQQQHSLSLPQPQSSLPHSNHQYTSHNEYLPNSIHHHANSTSHPNNSLSQVFKEFLKSVDPYYSEDQTTLCLRGTNNTNMAGAHVNKNCTDTIFQSNSIPSVTNNNEISSSLMHSSTMPTVPINNAPNSNHMVGPNLLKNDLHLDTISTSVNQKNNSSGSSEKILEKGKGKGVCTYNDARRMFLSSALAHQQIQNEKFLHLQIEQPSTDSMPNNQSSFLNTSNHQVPVHASHNNVHHPMPQSSLNPAFTNNEFSHQHHSFQNVHHLEQHISLMNSNNNSSENDYSQHIADAANYINQNENKKEDGTIVY